MFCEDMSDLEAMVLWYFVVASEDEVLEKCFCGQSRGLGRMWGGVWTVV
jgi:hypothetical protein